MAKLARAKRYPRSARKDGVTGTATVRFTIQKNGRVIVPRLLNSSGDERLDKEALAMLQRASPFPRIPAELGENSLDLTLPIEFSLNKTTRKLF
ncbi:energy transducer TonB [Neptunomonas marina]|uniref:Energy transducer TonB n=2 Tax=Neptunomonas marina TaxID=1815562 RepID=A0A437Q7Z7_9GAMM|nr:energy transducer TonB [Neptunomonas marina]